MSTADRPRIFEDRLTEALNAGAVITDVSIWPRNPNLLEVRAGDRTIARLREADLARLGELAESPVVDVADGLRQCIELDKARRLAMALLARRDFSHAALSERLVRRGADAAAADTIADELAAEGWVNDERLARSLVDQAIERGKATKPALEQVLAKHQIDPAASESIIDEALRETDQQQVATELARKRLATMTGVDDRARSRRVFAYLARRGFDEQAIRDALLECGVHFDDLND